MVIDLAEAAGDRQRAARSHTRPVVEIGDGRIDFEVHPLVNSARGKISTGKRRWCAASIRKCDPRSWISTRATASKPSV